MNLSSHWKSILKKSSKRQLTLLIAVTLICSSCALSPVLNPVRIDSAQSAKNSTEEKPEGLIEDAARLRPFNIFPESVSDSIDRIYKSGGDKKDTYREIQKLFCGAGGEAKVNGEFQVKVMPPQKARGKPLDEVTKSQKDFLYYARSFLKHRFFLTSAVKPATRFTGSTRIYDYNPDYAKYMLAKANDNESEPDLSEIIVPLMPSRTKKDLEKFYSDLPYLPLFLESRWMKQPDFQLDKFFFSIILENKSALLVPKASKVLYFSDDSPYAFKNNRPSPKIGIGAITESSDTLEALQTGPLNTYYTQVQVMPSDYGWKIKDQQVIYPLQVSYSKELNFLMAHYTFILSREILEKEFGITDPLMQKNLGIDFNSGKFLPSNSIENRGLIWEQVLIKSTSLKESPQADTSTVFSLTLDMGLYCRLSSSVMDLQSE